MSHATTAFRLAGAIDDAQNAYRRWSSSLDPALWPVDLELAATLERTARHIRDALRAPRSHDAYALLDAACAGCTACAGELARTIATGPQGGPGHTAALRHALWELFLQVDAARRAQAHHLASTTAAANRRAPPSWPLRPQRVDR